MRISTIIPSFNCEPYLRRAVESLLSTQYPDLEIVIVDDGSEDGTLELAESLRKEHSDVVRVEIHPQHVNKGVSASRNLGIESSSGDLIAFLDADDFVYPWRFESAERLLRTEADIDGVYELCELVFSDEQSARIWWPGQTTFGFAEMIPHDELLLRLLEGKCWATSAILIRRSLLSATGLFDPQFKLGEDCHLWFRMASCGRIVSGDLTRPVSAYCRRTTSAYQPSPWSRLSMIAPMASFYSWIARSDSSDPRLPEISRRISEFILRGVESARISGQRRLAWALLGTATMHFPPIRRNRRLYSNLARLAIGR